MLSFPRNNWNTGDDLTSCLLTAKSWFLSIIIIAYLAYKIAYILKQDAWFLVYRVEFARPTLIMLENLPISYAFRNFPKIFPIMQKYLPIIPSII